MGCAGFPGAYLVIKGKAVSGRGLAKCREETGNQRRSDVAMNTPIERAEED
jgi:hypothetical protein